MARVVFMGSPETALPALRALLDAPACEVVAVFSQPDRPAGRGRRLTPSPVKAAAEARAIPVHTPDRIRDDEARRALEAARPDLLIVCAYGQLLPQPVLDLPPLGPYNIHFSLLPRWRGASPVQAALLAGDAQTGVSLQRMVRELDAGPIVAETAPVPIAPTDTGATLAARLAEASGALLTEALPLLLSGAPPLREQEAARATFCRTIPKEAGRVDCAAEGAAEIERKVRAYDPWPGCHAFLGNRRLGLVKVEVGTPDAREDCANAPAGEVRPGGWVATREGWLRLVEVKPEGKGAMPFAAFVNGAPATIGRRLTPRPVPEQGGAAPTL